MRLRLLQRFLVALVLLSFFLCMVVAVAFISDFDILGFIFGDQRLQISKQDESLFNALFRLKTNLSTSEPHWTSVSVPQFFSRIERFRHDLQSNGSLSLSRSRQIYQKNMEPRPTDVVSSKNERPDNAGLHAGDVMTNDDGALPNYNVHVFYYPWYGNPSFDGQYLHWNHPFLPHWKPEITARHPTGRHVPPNDIGASFYPRLGSYSSRDPDIVEDHMKQIRRCGAGVLAISWYPPGLADDEGQNVDALVPALLDAADKYSLKVCFHIEPYKDRNRVTLRDNISYIVGRYGNHSAFYRSPTSKLPLYYIYDSYLVSDDQWRVLLRPDGSETVRKTPLDGIFIGLAVEQRHPDRLAGCGFDGLYTYFASERFTWGSTSRNWPALSATARRSGMLFVPSVGPGYDDVRIRPWNAENSRERENGRYYERSFASAVETLPDIITITSFNEWHEGTQIEEAVPKEIDDTRSYLDYAPQGSDYYLLLTRKWVDFYSKKMSAKT